MEADAKVASRANRQGRLSRIDEKSLFSAFQIRSGITHRVEVPHPYVGGIVDGLLETIRNQKKNA